MEKIYSIPEAKVGQGIGGSPFKHTVANPSMKNSQKLAEIARSATKKQGGNWRRESALSLEGFIE